MFPYHNYLKSEMYMNLPLFATEQSGGGRGGGWTPIKVMGMLIVLI